MCGWSRTQAGEQVQQDKVPPPFPHTHTHTASAGRSVAAAGPCLIVAGDHHHSGGIPCKQKTSPACSRARVWLIHTRASCKAPCGVDPKPCLACSALLLPHTSTRHAPREHPFRLQTQPAPQHVCVIDHTRRGERRRVRKGGPAACFGCLSATHPCCCCCCCRRPCFTLSGSLSSSRRQQCPWCWHGLQQAHQVDQDKIAILLSWADALHPDSKRG